MKVHGSGKKLYIKKKSVESNIRYINITLGINHV